MPLQLIKNGVDYIEGVTRQEFQKKYMVPQKPVIVKHFFGKDAPLYQKWTFDYFKQELGDLEVGIMMRKERNNRMTAPTREHRIR